MRVLPLLLGIAAGLLVVALILIVAERRARESTRITSASATFTPKDVHKVVDWPGVPTGTRILRVDSPTSVVVGHRRRWWSLASPRIRP